MAYCLGFNPKVSRAYLVSCRRFSTALRTRWMCKRMRRMMDEWQGRWQQAGAVRRLRSKVMFREALCTLADSMACWHAWTRLFAFTSACLIGWQSSTNNSRRRRRALEVRTGDQVRAVVMTRGLGLWRWWVKSKRRLRRIWFLVSHRYEARVVARPLKLWLQAREMKCHLRRVQHLITWR